MRRAVLTLAGTAAGLAALLSFKTHAAATPDAAPAASPAPSQSAAGSALATAAATRPAAGMTKAASGMSQSAPASVAARTVTGTVAQTPYGPMQVQLTVAGQKITGVNVLQHTNDGSESSQIDSFALPKLTSETLAAQSARIDAVSGASYTSSGYIKSLQSAVDQMNA